ncbi:MAG TPA: CoA-transferase [Gaiellaceae bacterium]
MSEDWAPAELVAVTMARAFRDGEVVVMGAVPTIPLAACRLARALHAPTLSYIVGGSGTVNPTPAALPVQSCDPELEGGPCTLPLPDVVLLEGRGDALDIFCAGGLQIDAHGNCNLVCVGDRGRPKLRGPGSVGLPFMPAVGRTVIYTLAHNPRTFVERVDFVSGAGDRAQLVVTPLATMDFDPESRRMRLASTHPGVSVDEVAAATGFQLLLPPSVPETPPPTADELAELRRLDPGGSLR